MYIMNFPNILQNFGKNVNFGDFQNNYRVNSEICVFVSTYHTRFLYCFKHFSSHLAMLQTRKGLNTKDIVEMVQHFIGHWQTAPCDNSRSSQDMLCKFDDTVALPGTVIWTWPFHSNRTNARARICVPYWKGMQIQKAITKYYKEEYLNERGSQESRII